MDRGAMHRSAIDFWARHIRDLKNQVRSHHAMIRVYDEAGYVIEAHEHKGNFKKC